MVEAKLDNTKRLISTKKSWVGAKDSQALVITPVPNLVGMLEVATFVEQMGNDVLVGTMGGWLLTKDKKDAAYSNQEIRFTFSDTLDIAESFEDEDEIGPILMFSDADVEVADDKKVGEVQSESSFGYGFLGGFALAATSYHWLSDKAQ